MENKKLWDTEPEWTRKITTEEIVKQRAMYNKVIALTDHASICTSQLLKQCAQLGLSALDALEASMQREAEKEKQCGIWRKASERLADHEKDLQQAIARLTAERDAEKCRADAAEKDLKTVCTLAIDEGADCACCAVCKHSRGMPPLGSSDDCDILRYDEKTDEIIGKCKWEWRGPCADNTDAPTGAESEQNNESES